MDALNAGNKVTIKVSNIKLTNSAISSFKEQLSSVINTLNLDKDVSISFTANDIGEITQQFRSSGDAAAEAAHKVALFKVQMEAIDSLKSSVKSALSSITAGDESGEEESRIAALRKQYEQWAIKIEEVRASKDGVVSPDTRAALEAEGAAIQENIEAIKKKQKAEKEAAAEATREAKRNKASTTELNNLYKQTVDAITRITKAQRDWSAAEMGESSGEYAKLSGYIERLQGIKSELFDAISDDAGDDADINKTNIKDRLSSVKKDFAESSQVIKEAGENTRTLSDRVGGLASKFASWLTISQVVMRLYQALQQMVGAVIEVDTAMTELRKVTEESEITYSKFLETAVTRSKQLGATVADTVTASADFARLGYSLDEAAQLADAAIIYKNVGDGIEDITTASESIISTMKAFGVEAENSMLIVDKFNEVGNNFAISSKGIGDALNPFRNGSCGGKQYARRKYSLGNRSEQRCTKC